MQGREKMFQSQESGEDEKKRKQKEYLKWWLSDKKK